MTNKATGLDTWALIGIQLIYTQRVAKQQCCIRATRAQGPIDAAEEGVIDGEFSAETV
jgi:hypothetical protein